jgi:hypothetical protein
MSTFETIYNNFAVFCPDSFSLPPSPMVVLQNYANTPRWQEGEPQIMYTLDSLDSRRMP